MYDLADSNTRVLLNNSVVTLKQALKAQREVSPQAAINYYKIVGEDGEGNFKLERQHTLAFKPAEEQKVEDSTEQKKNAQAFCGNLVPLTAWTTNATELIWSVQWKAKGLTPLRPQVLMACDGSLAPGRAVHLVAPSA